MTINNAQLEKAVRTLAEVREQKKALDEMEKNAKAIISENLPIGKTAFNDYIVSITETSRFNATEATRNLPADKLELISKMTPDSKLAKAHLDDETYKIACCTQSQTISVKPVTE